MMEQPRDFGPEEDVPPSETPDRRLLVLVLDMSSSMGQRLDDGDGGTFVPVDELRSALASFLTKLEKGQEAFAHNGEIAILAIINGQTDNWLRLGEEAVRKDSAVYFARNAWEQYDPDKVEANGNTPIFGAVAEALDVVDERLDELATDGTVLVSRPVIIALTDGMPTDGDRSQPVIAKAHKMEADYDALLWVAGMKGARRDLLEPLANKGNFVELEGRGIEVFMNLVSASISESGAGRRQASEIYDKVRQRLVVG